eukprot:CAMPEP_0201661518 /NCGR_PEP_ID=MMETSP0494-20130426/3867_1 /ASSEMBLY_ACC=CAM_ASM_000839 /TAXON_ID=420259 /ORGANISM="Thalassiosira gravida, Strain GMp14c1" /LENGTH=370 /DNA_ID=CAMNT_0048139655 /DNA_START=44 /DNA_END=1156 /DNA_ORIENTATION=+
MKVYQSNLAIVAIAAAATISPTATTAYSSSPIIIASSHRHVTTSTAKTSQFQLSMAFGLPDEGLRDDENDHNNDDDKDPSSIANDTLKSLTKKLEQSSVASKKKSTPKKDNNSMAFLKKIGRVGGAANKNFVNAVGSDEGSTGRQPPAQRDSAGVGGVGGGGGADGSPDIAKSKASYRECTATGIIDDLSNSFPMTSSGNEWRGITDRVMGGLSNGMLRRELDLEGRAANVLEGRVSLANNGGFLQMVTDLPLDASKQSVDASEYDGIEFDILYRVVDENDDKSGGSFNMHIRTPGTLQQASYRHTFQIEQPNTWEVFRVPFSCFEAYGGGPDMPSVLDASELRRIGIVGIGREMDVYLAMGGLRFYSVF